MELEGSLFLFLYIGVIGLITVLGLGFYLFKRKYGNVLFLSEGKIELSDTEWVKIKKVLPFMGEGFLIFAEIKSGDKKYYEIWGFSKSGGFRKISKIGD